MVHYRSINEALDARNYWKLWVADSARAARRYLQSRGKRPDSSWPEDLLLHATSQVQRGLIIYQNCSTTELRRFCTGRGIEIPAADLERDDMISHLEVADDHLTFHGLNELPAELRVGIYEYCMLSLETDGIPTQPPLTKVSRQARKEAMPLFYSLCQYFVRFADQWEILGSELTAFVTKASASVKRQVPDVRLAGAVNSQHDEEADVSFGIGDRPPDIYVQIRRLSRHAHGMEAEMEIDLKQHIEQFLADIDTQGGLARLQMSDIETLCEAFDPWG